VSQRTYHDVEFQIGDGPRERIFNEGYSLMITCTRAGGWELWGGTSHDTNERVLMAGEYNAVPLCLYVAGVQICGPKEKP
jgi:hypothetical protein